MCGMLCYLVESNLPLIHHLLSDSQITEYIQVHLHGNSVIEEYGTDNLSVGQGTPHSDFL